MDHRFTMPGLAGMCAESHARRCVPAGVFGGSGSILGRGLRRWAYVGVWAWLVVFAGPAVVSAQTVAEELPENGGDGEYVGITKCAACHYTHYKDWKTTMHSQAFQVLPEKYKQDAECLKCHTTGFGHPTTVNNEAITHEVGVSCESCHGPGGKHARYALTFVGQNRELTEEALKVLRSQIRRVALDQCMQCHVSQSHKPHPEFDRGESAKTNQASVDKGPKRGFFQVHKNL